MKQRLAIAAGILVALAQVVTAHRLDEYLQAAIVTVEKGRVQLDLRLTPGVAVLPAVLAKIDTNGDGVISTAEQRAYGEQVAGDLSLTSDGERVTLRLVSATFPTLAEMREGMGAIELELEAKLPTGGRSVAFQNRHMSPISAYLVNALVPRDPDVRIVGQNRNPSQSEYRVDYAVAGAGAKWGTWGLLGAAGLLLFARAAFLTLRTAP